MIRSATIIQLDTTTRPAQVVELRAVREDRHRELIREARDLMLEGLEEDALERCFQAVRIRHDSYEGYALAGTLLAMLGRTEQSIDYTRQAIQVAPTRPDAYYDLATTLLELGRADEALPVLVTGTALLGERRDDLVDFMYSAQAEALIELGRLEEARSVLAEGEGLCEDALSLLRGARELLEERLQRPGLRLVV